MKDLEYRIPDFTEALSSTSTPYGRLHAIIDVLERCNCTPMSVKTYSNHLLAAVHTSYCATIDGIVQSRTAYGVKWFTEDSLSLTDVDSARMVIETAGILSSKAREIISAKIANLI